MTGSETVMPFSKEEEHALKINIWSNWFYFSVKNEQRQKDLLFYAPTRVLWVKNQSFVDFSQKRT